MVEGGYKLLFTAMAIGIADGMETWRMVHLAQVGELMPHYVITQLGREKHTYTRQ